MFQQNNNKMYKTYGKKNKQSTIPWAIIIGCVIFTLICITVTGFAIWYRNSMDANYIQQMNAEKLKQSMEKMKIEGLSERYKPNDIDTIYSIEHIGPSRDNSLEQDEHNKINN